jgi:hypothetical protein
MATKTKTKASRKKTPRTAAPAEAAPAKRGRPRSVATDIRKLVGEVRDLRTLRDKYNQLVKEHDGLLGAIRDLSSELGTSARKAWGTYRGGPGAPAAAFRTRVRTASGDVDAQYDKLLAVLPSAWTSKQDICKAAGLDPRQCNTAFRRLVTGFKRGGKTHAPRLQSNDKRGTEGRYRKA